jgi:hypothetical protein
VEEMMLAIDADFQWAKDATLVMHYGETPLRSRLANVHSYLPAFGEPDRPWD